ncbi:MAG: hypothetical protein V3U64_05100 [Cocleimonas sp.]
MIESRYTIEYIGPHSTQKKSLLGKLFRYSLILLGLALIVALLAFSDFFKNTSTFVFNKFQALNSQRLSSISAPKTTRSTITEPSIVVESNQESPTSNNKIEELKKEIEYLSQENTNQHEATINYISENQSLSATLASTAENLAKERDTIKQLQQEIEALSTENNTISAELTDVSKASESYNKELLKIKAEAISASVQEVEMVEAPKPTSTNLVVTERISFSETKEEKVKKEEPKVVSPMDAIIAAMEASKNTSDTTNRNVTPDSSVIK